MNEKLEIPVDRAPAATKTIVITGASDGIGAHLAQQLAEPGVALVLAARRADALAAVAGQCEARGAQALVVPTDVADPQACRALIARGLERFGRIDTLVNNAGMSAHALLADIEEKDLGWTEQLMRVNHWGAVWCTHAALPHLLATRGQIVAISSLAGLVGVPGRTAYCATKFAMTGFFEALRVELMSSGVSVTLVHPGVVATETRRRGFDARGEAAGVSGLKEDGAMPPQACARLIARAMARRQRELVMTTRGKLGRWLKLLAPALVDRLALAALSDHQRPS